MDETNEDSAKEGTDCDSKIDSINQQDPVAFCSPDEILSPDAENEESIRAQNTRRFLQGGSESKPTEQWDSIFSRFKKPEHRSSRKIKSTAEDWDYYYQKFDADQQILISEQLNKQLNSIHCSEVIRKRLFGFCVYLIWKLFHQYQLLKITRLRKGLECNCGNPVILRELRVSDRTITSYFKLLNQGQTLFDIKRKHGKTYQPLRMIKPHAAGRSLIRSLYQLELSKLKSKLNHKAVVEQPEIQANPDDDELEYVLPYDCVTFDPIELGKINELAPGVAPRILEKLFALLPRLEATSDTKSMELEIYRALENFQLVEYDIFMLQYLIKFRHESLTKDWVDRNGDSHSKKCNLRKVVDIAYYFKNMSKMRQQYLKQIEDDWILWGKIRSYKLGELEMQKWQIHDLVSYAEHRFGEDGKGNMLIFSFNPKVEKLFLQLVDHFRGSKFTYGASISV